MNLQVFFLLILTIFTNIHCKKIALCSVATGKYAAFVKNFIKTADKNFLTQHDLTYFIFTDQILAEENPKLRTISWPHKSWPFCSMMRFAAYYSIANKLKDFDYVFACDIDMTFNKPINDEILGDLVGTLHPGFYLKTIDFGTIEKNENSAAYWGTIPPEKYFAGGFYGGNSQQFLKLIQICNQNVNLDLAKNIIAQWHDETHLNKFFSQNAPTLELSPAYCFPEEALKTALYPNIQNLPPKIVALKKQHNIMRSQKIALSDREFVIFIPSYNNIRYYKKNLKSAFTQNYTKYRILYIDDSSSDGTGNAVTKYVKQMGQAHRTIVINNKQRNLALANIYYYVNQYCLDHEIVVMLDGDDQLANPQVLTILNEIYRKSNTWFTYGNNVLMSNRKPPLWSKTINPCQIEFNAFREWDGAPTHLRTFYTWLFKQVKNVDLKDDKNFYTMCSDVAIHIPMLEMAGHHHKFITDILYLYNDKNPINDFKIDQKLALTLNKFIRTQKPKYSPICKTIYFEKLFLPTMKNDHLNFRELTAIFNDLIANLESIYDNSEDIWAIINKVLAHHNSEKLLATAKTYDYQFVMKYLK